MLVRWLLAAFLVAHITTAGCTRESQADDAAPPSAPNAAASQPQAASITTSLRDYVINPVIDPLELDWPAGAAQRIVTLAPNLTETAFALGLGERVVARDRFSAHPPGVRELPDLGGLMDRQIEQIAAQHPDLVVLVRSEQELGRRLNSVGIRTLICPDGTLDDIYTTIRQVGAATGRPRTAATLIDRLRNDVAMLSRAVTSAAVTAERPTRVAVFAGRMTLSPPTNFVANRQSMVGAFFASAGFELPVPDTSNPWPQITPEGLAAFNPDVVIETVPHDADLPAVRAEALARWQSLGDLGAVRNGRLIVLPDPGYLFIPGPRVNLALRDFALALE